MPGGPLTIGESLSMAAMITGLQAEDIDGFIVIAVTPDGDGRLVHNCQSYLSLITTLLGHVQSLIGEMQVDQVIEFHQAEADHDPHSGKDLPASAVPAPVQPGRGPAHLAVPGYHAMGSHPRPR